MHALNLIAARQFYGNCVCDWLCMYVFVCTCGISVQTPKTPIGKLDVISLENVSLAHVLGGREGRQAGRRAGVRELPVLSSIVS